ncbi:hypothetical protein DL96DRAFT_1709018 [Flagelloscypha sp. PMI_526]|nr:hypothetical protein DL96DRAFT_1709018 [Flagelloscypha sp. PMI_526]
MNLDTPHFEINDLFTLRDLPFESSFLDGPSDVNPNIHEQMKKILNAGIRSPFLADHRLTRMLVAANGHINRVQAIINELERARRSMNDIQTNLEALKKPLSMFLQLLKYTKKLDTIAFHFATYADDWELAIPSLRQLHWCPAEPDHPKLFDKLTHLSIGFSPSGCMTSMSAFDWPSLSHLSSLNILSIDTPRLSDFSDTNETLAGKANLIQRQVCHPLAEVDSLEVILWRQHWHPYDDTIVDEFISEIHLDKRFIVCCPGKGPDFRERWQFMEVDLMGRPELWSIRYVEQGRKLSKARRDAAI